MESEKKVVSSCSRGKIGAWASTARSRRWVWVSKCWKGFGSRILSFTTARNLTSTRLQRPTNYSASTKTAAFSTLSGKGNKTNQNRFQSYSSITSSRKCGMLVLLYDRMEADWPSKPNVLWTWGSFQWTISLAHSSSAHVINLKQKHLCAKKKGRNEMNFLATFTVQTVTMKRICCTCGTKTRASSFWAMWSFRNSIWFRVLIGTRVSHAKEVYYTRIPHRFSSCQKEVESTFVLCLSQLTYAYIIQVFIRSCKWVSICAESKGTFWSRSTCRAS